MTLDRPRLTVVVNPQSGRGRAGRLLGRVSTILAKADREVVIIPTRDYEHARAEAERVVDQARTHPDGRADQLVMMGGDGMASLGFNACAGTDVELGIIPAGTGNDFVRSAGIPIRPLKAAQTIVDGTVRRVDLARAVGQIHDGDEQRYAGTVVVSGYDARVNARVNAQKWRIGPLKYAIAVLTEFRHFKPIHYRLTIDGEFQEFDAILVAIGNGGHIGGGIHICPEHDLTDGELDLNIVRPVGLGTLFKLFPQLFRSGFVEHPAISQLRAHEVILDGVDLLPMADGEPLGVAPLTVTAEQQILSLVVPRLAS